MYTIRLSQARGAWLVIDGQDQVPLTLEHRVTVRRAPVQFRLVKVPGHSYFQTLRDKLRWGTAPNYRGEPAAAAERISDCRLTDRCDFRIRKTSPCRHTFKTFCPARSWC